MRAQENDRLTRIGPSTVCGTLLRKFWHPIATLDEFSAEVDPACADRPVKALTLLGQNFVLFRDENGNFGLLDRQCPHRGADLSFGRLETSTSSRWGAPSSGLRCPFHGWKFATNGQCLDTPAEPEGSRLCDSVRARSYPLQVKNQVIWAWLGLDEDGLGSPPALPQLDWLIAPDTHTFAFKGVWNCNWLQAQEVGLDPAHVSFLHAFFEDEDLSQTYGRQFRSASAGDIDGERWPMTRIMREVYKPSITTEPTPWGQKITTLRQINQKYTHVRITHGLFPNGFVIPLSETMTITQFHIPIDDTSTYWFSLFTSFSDPIDKKAMRDQRLLGNPAPQFLPIKGRHNAWGFNAKEQATKTMLGMGEIDINVHDQWACESMGVISDRTREHLGTTDKAILANRRQMSQALKAIEQSPQSLNSVDLGFASPDRDKAMLGPDTIDGLAPAAQWETWWQDQVAAKRKSAPWT